MTEPERFFVGSIECWVHSDGFGIYEPEMIFSDVSPEAAQARADNEPGDKGKVHLPYRCLLVRSGDRLCLFDAGLGHMATEFGYPAGRLADSLSAAGVAAEDIDVVVISHAHGDHIGGLVSMNGGRTELVYRKARHVLWRREWEYWTSEENLAPLPEMFSGPPRRCLPPIAEAGMLELVDDEETEILPGVRLVEAAGHTPGHVAAAIRSGDEEAMYYGDAIIHADDFANPDRARVLDGDAEMTRISRRRLLSRSAETGGAVVAFHVASAGTVSATNGAYHWSPLQPARGG